MAALTLTPADLEELIDLIVAGTVELEGYWQFVTSRVITPGDARFLIEALARSAATVAALKAGPLDPERGFWGVDTDRADGASPPLLAANQLIVACLNNDEPALDGLLAGIMQSEARYVGLVAAFTAAAFRQAVLS